MVVVVEEKHYDASIYYTLFFYKNEVYKNARLEMSKKLRIY